MYVSSLKESILYIVDKLIMFLNNLDVHKKTKIINTLYKLNLVLIKYMKSVLKKLCSL